MPFQRVLLLTSRRRYFLKSAQPSPGWIGARVQVFQLFRRRRVHNVCSGRSKKI